MGLQIQKNIKKVDVYAYAMILYQVFANTKPWLDVTTSEIEEKVLANTRPEIPKSVDAKIANLIERCWHSNPETRTTFTDSVIYLLGYCRQKEIA